MISRLGLSKAGAEVIPSGETLEATVILNDLLDLLHGFLRTFGQVRGFSLVQSGSGCLRGKECDSIRYLNQAFGEAKHRKKR